ncbi:hypothetical protein LILAB_10035 [Corallococcus macrosporus]|uniref:Uncharacterized protein n=1 Tax=Myxococcus fulvus (strain ATCC BAA-855 / HW-1) TaxID=483219 RepID=F8CL05_MYXFH|nr:hypothetical protein LILAB_10035 [Corallococcus macrosporus]
MILLSPSIILLTMTLYTGWSVHDAGSDFVSSSFSWMWRGRLSSAATSRSCGINNMFFLWLMLYLAFSNAFWIMLLILASCS